MGKGNLYKIILSILVFGVLNCPLFAQEDNFVIIKSIASNQVIDPAVLALHQNGQLYLPFDYLTKGLSLVLNYNKKEHTITGWVDDESQQVLIEFNKGEGRSGKKMFAVEPSDFIYYEGELYLNLKLVDNILGSTTEFDFNTQTVTMQTIGNLPFEKELTRQQRRDKFDRIAKEKERKRQEELNKEVYTQKDFIQPPFIDLSAKYSIYDNETGSDTNLGYSVNASFMTGSFDSNAYLYSSTDKEPPLLTLKTAKIDEDGNILGLFKQLEMGDIYSYSSLENQGAPNGWGIKMSTDDIFNTDGKTYNVRSELPLGWEVELYRNGEMLGYQNTSQDGFFEFTGIPLLLGKNVFKFVFYGPQGQVKEKYDILFFNGNILDKGKTRVKLNYVNKNRYLVELRDKPRDTSLGHYAMGEFGYGITDNLTLTLSAIADSLETPLPYPPGSYIRRDKTFAAAELSLFAYGIFSSLSTIADFKEQALTLSYYAQTSVYDWDIIFENNYFGDAVLSRNIYSDTFIKNQTSFRVSKTLNFGVLGVFPFSYYLSHFCLIDGQDQTEHFVSLSKNLPYNFYVNLTYQNSHYISSTKSENIGLNINKLYGQWMLRSNTLYDLIYHGLRNAEISAYRNLTERLKLGLKYDYVARDIVNKRYESLYSASLNWTTKIGFFSFEVGTSNRHNNYAFISYNLGVLPDKRNGHIYTSASKLQGTGAISAMAFMDANMNGIYDENEVILPDAEFNLKPRINTLDSRHETEEGKKIITHIPAYRRMDVVLNTSNVQDTLSLLNVSGDKTIKLRPAQVMYMDFPVVGTGDIEGTVYIKDNDKRKEARGIILKLYNADTKELVSSKISEYDGYYIFQQLPMGKYEIVIDEDQSKDLDLEQSKQVKITLNEFEQLEIRDIILNQTDTDEDQEEYEEEYEEEETLNEETISEPEQEELLDEVAECPLPDEEVKKEIPNTKDKTYNTKKAEIKENKKEDESESSWKNIIKLLKKYSKQSVSNLKDIFFGF